MLSVNMVAIENEQLKRNKEEESTLLPVCTRANTNEIENYLCDLGLGINLLSFDLYTVN